MIIVYGLFLATSLVILLILRFGRRETVRNAVSKIAKKDIKSDLRNLNPMLDADECFIEFYMRKCKIFLVVIFFGALLSLVFEVSLFKNEVIDENGRIKRNDYLSGVKREKLLVENLFTGEQEKVDVIVDEKQYTAEQIDSFVKELEEMLPTQIMSDNVSLDHICYNMFFPTSVSNYPFSITWRTDDPLLVSSKGQINQERLEKLSKSKDISEGILTGIHARLQYREYNYELMFYVRIFESDLNNELSLSEYVKLLVEEENENSKTEDYLNLPTQINGVPIAFRKAIDNRGMIVFIMAVLTAILLYLREDQELRNKLSDRKEEMLDDYPRIVNKFVLFYSAGLSTRSIWAKLCREYQLQVKNGAKRRYVYEEMLISESKIREGIGEMQALEDFAGRCNVYKYRHFISLIEQSILRGRDDLLICLQKESENAFEERKLRAKELGEKAGTKLLIPMFLMLFVVLIIVMIPAFITFKM